MALYDYRIAANNNVALNSLVNIESITPTSDIPFFAPSAYFHSTPGTRRARLNGQGYRAGFPAVDWVFGAMTQRQYDYLISNFCTTGAYSGPVTIYTKVGRLSYARYNAVIDVPETEGSGEYYAFKAIRIRFTRLVAL